MFHFKLIRKIKKKIRKIKKKIRKIKKKIRKIKTFSYLLSRSHKIVFKI